MLMVASSPFARTGFKAQLLQLAISTGATPLPLCAMLSSVHQAQENGKTVPVKHEKVKRYQNYLR